MRDKSVSKTRSATWLTQKKKKKCKKYKKNPTTTCKKVKMSKKCMLN